LARRLLEQRSPEEIATALVRAHRGRMPVAEEMVDGGSAGGGDSRGRSGGEARESGHRAGFDDTIWFRMDIGRRQNADPRWILPLLCRRGHVTKNEIGAIRIAAGETWFEIPRAAAGRFAAALKRTAGGDPEGEGGVRIEPAPGPPRDGGRRPDAPRPRLYKAKPNRPAAHRAR
jgi:ATP-dependent RNA helicase DeaD